MLTVAMLLMFQPVEAPDRTAGIALIEAHIKDGLLDPDSAKFEWAHGFVKGWYQRPMGRKHLGWITCGTVNAKNTYGGYVGKSAAIGVIRDGVVVESNVDGGGYGGVVASACRKIGVPVR